MKWYKNKMAHQEIPTVYTTGAAISWGSQEQTDSSHARVLVLWTYPVLSAPSRTREALRKWKCQPSQGMQMKSGMMNPGVSKHRRRASESKSHHWPEMIRWKRTSGPALMRCSEVMCGSSESDIWHHYRSPSAAAPWGNPDAYWEQSMVQQVLNIRDGISPSALHLQGQCLQCQFIWKPGLVLEVM